MTATDSAPERLAVVLFNLGGPTSKEAIYPFLVNFFMDPNIIKLPYPLRFALSRLIAWKRSRGEALEAYGEMGGSSPLLENTLAQEEAIQAALVDKLDVSKATIKTFTCMRYWHPMAESVVPMVQAFKPTRVVLVSLYPQFSTTTFWSSLEQWHKYTDEFGLNVPTTTLCCYPKQDGFIAASTELMAEKIRIAEKEIGCKPRVLFSAHSLPESIIRQGDSYAAQCQQTVDAVVDKLASDHDLTDLDVVTCYQSKVGPQKWLGPQTEDEIERAGEEKTPIIIYPHAFVSEHVETIVELGVEYREVAEHAGVPYYDVVPTVGTHATFVDGLADEIIARRHNDKIEAAQDDGSPVCPCGSYRCCQRYAPKKWGGQELGKTSCKAGACCGTEGGAKPGCGKEGCNTAETCGSGLCRGVEKSKKACCSSKKKSLVNAKKMHSMHLDKQHFDAMKSGTKTIEVRALDNKRQAINVGDFINFKNRDTEQTLIAQVTQLVVKDTIVDLGSVIDVGMTGHKDLDHLNQTYNHFYDDAEQKSTKALAIYLNTKVTA